jgi:dTDP-4-amino-4,6-dideoxygalactose transaminase
MKARGIQTSIHYPPIHLFRAYQGNGLPRAKKLERTESLAVREVSLPLYPSLPEEDVILVVEAVRDALEEARRESA